MLEFLRNKSADDINVARNFFTKGDYKKAEKICTTLLEKNEKDPETLYLLSEIYQKLNMNSEYKDTCIKLVDCYIEQNNYNKGIATLKMLSRRLPYDDTILIKMAEIYEANNMFKELQSILFDLGNFYINKEMTSEASEVFLRILGYNKRIKDLSVCLNVIDKFQILDNKLMVCSAVNDGIAYALEKDDQGTVNKFIDIASKYDCDLTRHIKITLDFFRNNPAKIGFFNKNAINYFININKSIDKDFLKDMLGALNYELVSDVVDRILDKYNTYEVYEFLFDIFTIKKDIEGLNFLLEELNNIYKPTADYANIIIEYYDRIEDAKTLYELGLFCIKCNNVFSAELILNKSLKLAENKGNSELAGVVTSKLDEIKSNKSESIDIKIMQTDKDLVFQKIPGSDEISNTEKPKNNVAMDSENYDIEISINDIEVLDEESIYGKALELMRNKSYHEAIVELKKIINTNKKFDVLLNMGMCFEAIENFNEALKRYNEALTKTPNIAYKKKILLKLADLYFDLDNRAKTYSTLKKLFDLDPEFIIPSDK